MIIGLRWNAGSTNVRLAKWQTRQPEVLVPRKGRAGSNPASDTREGDAGLPPRPGGVRDPGSSVVIPERKSPSPYAALAQQAEQAPCKGEVVGSKPSGGSGR